MASLDMSLDDIIKNRRNTDRGRGRGRARDGRGQGRSFGGGRPTGPRRGPLAVNAWPSAYTISKSFRRPNNSPWQRDFFEESLRAVGLPAFDDGAKLNVSNLDIGVTNEDIRELFSKIGELKRYAINYDKNGRPIGSAEVLFARRSDAFQALKRYNNVQLDGKPMKIEIEGSNYEIPGAPVTARVNGVGLNGQRTVVMTSGFGRGRGADAANWVVGSRFGRGRGADAANWVVGLRNCGGMRPGRGGMTDMRGIVRRRGRGRGRGQNGGRGRGRGWKPAVDKSANELDKELEKYHAMQQD